MIEVVETLHFKRMKFGKCWA